MYVHIEIYLYIYILFVDKYMQRETESPARGPHLKQDSWIPGGFGGLARGGGSPRAATGLGIRPGSSSESMLLLFMKEILHDFIYQYRVMVA